MTPMWIELRALDPDRKEAVFSCSRLWYRLRADRKWQPEDLGDRPPSWMSEARFLQVREVYRSIPGLIAALEHALRAEEPGEIRSRLRFFDAGPAAAWKEELVDHLRLYYHRLDALFADRGCTAQESKALILETFRRLRRMGPLSGQEVAERLPLLAKAAYDDTHRRRPAAEVPRDAPGRPGRRPHPAALYFLKGFGKRTLQCLVLWAADPRNDEARIALLLQIPADEVRARIQGSAEKLGRPPGQLRGAKWHADFSEALRRSL